MPCTTLSIAKVIQELKINCASKNVTILGNSYLVGNPAKLLMQHLNATTTTCHEFTSHETVQEECLNADIIISATGVPGLINGTNVKPGAVIIDVGTHVDSAGKIWGDFNPEIVSF